MKVGGRITRQMAKGDLYMLMETFMMGTGWMTRLMASVSILIWTERGTKATGKRTNSTERVWRLGQMERATKEITSRERSMELANLLGQITLLMMASLLTITSTATAFTCGQMAADMKDSGRIIRWRVMAYSHGLITEGTRVSM